MAEWLVGTVAVGVSFHAGDLRALDLRLCWWALSELLAMESIAELWIHMNVRYGFTNRTGFALICCRHKQYSTALYSTVHVPRN